MTVKWCRLALAYPLLAVLLISMAGCHQSKPDLKVTTARDAKITFSGYQMPIQNYPPTSDPRIILNRVSAAYHKLNSFQSQSSAKIQLGFASAVPYYQTTVFRFQRPNRVYLKSNDPQEGEILVECDGNTIAYYYGAHDSYTREVAPKTLEEVCAKITHDAPQLLDAIVFMANTNIPMEIAHPVLAGSSQVNGRKALVIRSDISTSWLQSIAKAAGLPNKGYRLMKAIVTAYVDQQTYCLLRVTHDLEWAPASGTPAAQSRSIILKTDETFSAVVANPPFPPDAFRYIPKPGTHEIIQEPQS
ncbi:MAG: DUF2092 domain-containing protein [Armatimonadetes bacterium]|nr:DUF2092 domain-containing protein [Armatimonadota bacterium]